MENNLKQNPLSSYFRRPAIYIKLPSQGKFYPDGTLQMPENKELPVFPMTAIDEISYRTPDALFNGQAVVDVIQSCVPNIKNAWAVPSTDLDAILVAIRIASYGHEMDINTTCPKCNEEETYSLDLRSVAESLKTPDFSKHVVIGDLEVYFKPLSFKQVNENNIVRFEEEKLMSVLTTTEIDEEQKIKMLADAFKKVSTLTVKAVRQGIHYIKTPESVVSTPEFIDDFLKNCERSTFDRIRDYVINLKSENEIKPLNMTCKSCGHKYLQPFTLDMTSFFA